MKINNEIHFPVVGPKGQFRVCVINPDQDKAGMNLAVFVDSQGRVMINHKFHKDWISYEELCYHPERLGLDYEPMPEKYEHWKKVHESVLADSDRSHPAPPKEFYHPHVLKLRGEVNEYGKRVHDPFADLGYKTESQPRGRKSREKIDGTI